MDTPRKKGVPLTMAKKQKASVENCNNAVVEDCNNSTNATTKKQSSK